MYVRSTTRTKASYKHHWSRSQKAGPEKGRGTQQVGAKYSATKNTLQGVFGLFLLLIKNLPLIDRVLIISDMKPVY